MTAQLLPAMNNTKWDELRLEMYSLTPPPAWSTLSIKGYQSPTDREWFYHFKAGRYDDILHVDIHVETSEQRHLVRSALRRIHVPGEENSSGFRIFGYLHTGQFANYI